MMNESNIKIRLMDSISRNRGASMPLSNRIVWLLITTFRILYKKSLEIIITAKSISTINLITKGIQLMVPNDTYVVPSDNQYIKT